MDITTEAGALFDSHPRRKNKILLLDITLVNTCVSSDLKNVVCHAGKNLANAVERKNNKYRGSFPDTYSLLPLAMSKRGVLEQLACSTCVMWGLVSLFDEPATLHEGSTKASRGPREAFAELVFETASRSLQGASTNPSRRFTNPSRRLHIPKAPRRRHGGFTRPPRRVRG